MYNPSDDYAEKPANSKEGAIQVDDVDEIYSKSSRRG